MARTQEKTTEILDKVLTAFQSAYRSALDNEGHRSSGALEDDQSFTVEYLNQNWVITLNMRKYWRYLEYGTKPHFPPIDAILSWIKVKPILPRDKKTGRFLPHRRAAFLICRKIAREGTPATHTLQRTMDAFGFRNKVLRAIFAKHSADVEKAFATVFADLERTGAVTRK